MSIDHLNFLKTNNKLVSLFKKKKKNFLNKNNSFSHSKDSVKIYRN